MDRSFSSIGISRMWQRRGLVVVIYVVGLGLAAFVGSGLYRMLEVEIGPTGFSRRLVERFDVVLWLDYWDNLRPGLAALARQAAFAGLIMMVWKVASALGLIHALHEDATAGFWAGVRRFTIRGLGLALLYFIPLVILIAVVLIAGAAVVAPMGEFGTFWMWSVVLPLVVIGLVGSFDLFHDYARMHLVHHGSSVGRAWVQGLRWPFRRFRAVFLYKLWFIVCAALWAGVFLLGFYLPDQTVLAVIVAFLLQQILIIVRIGASVSWFGAELAFFEHFAVPPPALELSESGDDLTAVYGNETVEDESGV